MRFLVVFLGGLLFLPIASAAEPVGVPVLTVGDAWEYVGNATARAGSAALRRHVEVMEVGESIKVRWFTQSQTSLGSNGTIDQLFWLRPADLAIERMASLTKAGNETVTNEARLLMNYTQPCAERAFPLVVGKEWSVDCVAERTTLTVTRRVDDNESRQQSASVVRELTVNTPAATLPTFVLVHNGTAGSESSTAHFSPPVCNDAKFEGLRAGTTTQLELVGWRCASAGTSGGALTMTLPEEPTFAAPTRQPVTVPTHAQPFLGLVGAIVAVGIALALRR